MNEPAAAPRLDLAAYLPYRLSILSNTVSGAIASIYGKRHGLAVADWRLMAILGMEPERPLTQKALCARTRMDKVQVSRAVKRLLGLGYIEREVDFRGPPSRPSAADRPRPGGLRRGCAGNAGMGTRTAVPADAGRGGDPRHRHRPPAAGRRRNGARRRLNGAG